jgi:hypothetical protein
MAEVFEPLEGGCLCGQFRYRVTAAPVDGSYCHCRMCQRSSGAPLQISAEIPPVAFEVTKGHLATYRSSSKAVRRFCPTCGSQILFAAAEAPDYISINVPTLDRPEALPPRKHIWCESRISWFETTDALPRHNREGPPVGGE